MTTADLDPELVPLVEAFRLPVLEDRTLDELRRALAAQGAAAAGPAGEARIAPGLDGDPPVGVLLHGLREDGPARPAILHIHGGGFVLGSAAAVGAEARRLAQDLDAVVACVDYRLAPETPYPAALHDCAAALAWIAEEAASLGVDASRVAVLGDSAGGGLAASLALYARDHGGPVIAMQALSQPMLDDRTGTAAPAGPSRHVWREDHNRYGWSRYLSGAAAGPDGYAAAARARDLAGLPPAFLAVGALDLFLDEDLAYVSRLAAAGVAVEAHVYPGAPHAFDLAVDAAVGARYRRDRNAALRRALHPS